MTDEEFVAAVLEESRRARAKFPQPNPVMCALTEEVGELAKAHMDEPWSCVEKEAIQVAAMALRVAIEGDPTLWVTRLSRGQSDGPVGWPDLLKSVSMPTDVK